MNNQIDKYLGLGSARKGARISERALASRAGISRGTLRAVEAGKTTVTLNNLISVAAALNLRIQILCRGKEGASDCSTVAVSMSVQRNGFDSWKIHFMNLVDEFRACGDPALLLLEPVISLQPKLRALLASIVLELCFERGMNAPSWAQRSHFLSTPWFVSGSDSLKAMALLESPLSFRRNNIFVLGNFMERV